MHTGAESVGEDTSRTSSICGLLGVLIVVVESNGCALISAYLNRGEVRWHTEIAALPSRYKGVAPMGRYALTPAAFGRTACCDVEKEIGRQPGGDGKSSNPSHLNPLGPVPLDGAPGPLLGSLVGVRSCNQASRDLIARSDPSTAPRGRRTNSEMTFVSSKKRSDTPIAPRRPAAADLRRRREAVLLMARARPARPTIGPCVPVR